MIVDPDFLDHWRTRMLVDALGCDELAPMYVLRLWAHCQVRRGTTFEIPPAGLKALCKAGGDAQKFDAAMAECGFIRRDGASIEVLGWADHNAKLVANWKNGGTGGRPKADARDADDERDEEHGGNPRGTQKKPKKNPSGTEEEPTDNPAATQPEPTNNPQEPTPNPLETDKRREEKKEEIHPPTPQGGRDGDPPDEPAKAAKPKRRRSGDEDPPNFDRFWAAYPRKVGKDAAVKAFAKREPDDAMLAAMLGAIEAQGLLARCQRGEERFVPHPATWLNARRWEDEVESPPGDFIGSAEGRLTGGVVL